MKYFRHIVFMLASVAIINCLCFLFFQVMPDVLSGSDFSKKISLQQPNDPDRFQKSAAKSAISEVLAIEVNTLTETRSTEDIMKDIASISGNTEGSLVYKWFLELQSQLEEQGHFAYEIYNELSQLDGSDASSRRKLSLFYGVLAQSSTTEALNVLKQSVEADQSEYHMIQALAALGDIPRPDAQAAHLLWEQSQGHADSLVRNTALLALGSIAYRGVSESYLIRNNLLAISQNELDSTQKGVLIAAMGNHGDAEYWPYLQLQGQSADETIRASALYGSRNLPQEEVNDWITQIAVSDQSLYVKSEALKVLAIRSERFDLSRDLTKVALSKPDLELQMHATNLLISLARDYRDSSQESLTRLSVETPFAAVKDYIRQTPSY